MKDRIVSIYISVMARFFKRKDPPMSTKERTKRLLEIHDREYFSYRSLPANPNAIIKVDTHERT